MTPVYAFLHAYRARPFVLGVCDCCTLLADWVRLRCGADPAAHLRHAYSTPGELQRLTGWYTDPVAVIESCLATVRSDAFTCPRVTIPEPGDIAVIEQPGAGRDRAAGAIWTGSAWGIKGDGGQGTLHPAAVSALAIWKMTDAA